MSKFMLGIIAVLLVLLESACEGGYPTGKLQQRETVSSCGGFGDKSKVWLGDPAAYCDAEVLHWYYQPDSHNLQLVDARAYLNCCGEQHVLAELANGIYLVTETINPDSVKGWCSCQCVFDLSVEIQDIGTAEVHIKLVREVNNDPATVTVLFDNTIDLSPLSGSIPLNEAAIDPDDCTTLLNNASSY